MTQVEVLDARPNTRGGYKVDVSRGERVGRVSSEWFNRPADERYLSLADLFASVKGRSERSRTRTVESAAVRVEAIGVVVFPGSGISDNLADKARKLGIPLFDFRKGSGA